MTIEPYDPRHLDALIDLSLRAWAPVFASLQMALDADVYAAFYPEGWEASQRKLVADACAADDVDVWVAVQGAVTAGFVAVKLHIGAGMGEIYMIAVDPTFQGRGIGAALTDFALRQMKGAGMAVAMVETGGDPGHAPARRVYERAGFTLLPIARYFQKL